MGKPLDFKETAIPEGCKESDIGKVVREQMVQYENGRLFGVYCQVQGVMDPWTDFNFHEQQSRIMGYTK